MAAGIDVIVPAVTDFKNLERTLKALERERGSFALDAYVVSRQGETFDRRVQEHFGWAHVIGVSAETSIPLMRREGVARAARPIVAVIEDHVVVPPGWASRMAERVSQTGGVVAGPLTNAATDTLTNQAAFLCEYSQSLPPVMAGEVDWLPGNNTAYPIDLLRRHVGVLEHEGWEDALHASIRAEGGRLWLDPAVTAAHDLPVTVIGYIRDRFTYSRAFAGSRLRGAPFAKRLLYAAGSVVLPAVLLGRILSRSLARPGYRALALMSLPLLTLFVVAWAAGELVGYLAGQGTAMRRVR